MNNIDKLKFDTKKLPNGHVLYTQASDLQVTYIKILIPTGSAHSNTINKDCVGGCFHFLEHMCFEPSELNPDKTTYMELLASAGAVQNAWTDAFYTLYNFESPAHTFHKVLPAFLNKIISPLFNLEDIKLQKDIITNERNQRKYFPGEDALSQYSMTSWMNSSYYSKEQLFGSDSDLESFTPETLHSIHTNYFNQPIHIFVSGTFNIELLIKQLSKLPQPTEHVNLISKLNSPNWVNQKYHTYICSDIDKPVYFLGGIYNDFTLEDFWATEFIYQMLTHEEFGSLQQWIRKENGWSYGLELNLECEKDRVVWTIKIPLETNGIVETVRAEIHSRILATIKNASLIKANQDRILLQMCFDLETISSRLDSAVLMFNLTGNVVTESQYKSWLANIVNSDYIMTMYLRHFAPDKTGEFLAVPKG